VIRLLSCKKLFPRCLRSFLTLGGWKYFLFVRYTRSTSLASGRLRAFFRTPIPPIRGDLLFAEKLFKAEPYSRPASIRYCRDEPKILSNLAWIPDEIPRRYFLHFMSSQPFHAQDPRNFDKEKYFTCNILCEKSCKKAFMEKFLRKLHLHAATSLFY